MSIDKWRYDMPHIAYTEYFGINVTSALGAVVQHTRAMLPIEYIHRIKQMLEFRFTKPKIGFTDGNIWHCQAD